LPKLIFGEIRGKRTMAEAEYKAKYF